MLLVQYCCSNKGKNLLLIQHRNRGKLNFYKQCGNGQTSSWAIIVIARAVIDCWCKTFNKNVGEKKTIR